MKQLSIGLIALLSVFGLQAQTSECFSLYLSTETASAGETVCLEVSADGIADLLSMQFSVRWQAEALRFARIENIQMPGLLAENFNTLPAAVNNGFLALNWFDLSFSGLTLPDGSPLFSLCFEVLASSEPQQPVRFSASPTPIEFIKLPGQVATVFSLIDGGIQLAGAANPLDIVSACALYGDCQDGGHSILIEAQGGQAPYAYSWLSGGQLISTAENLIGDFSGTFELLVEDDAGRQSTAFFNLTPASVPYVLGAEIQAASCGQPDDGYILLQLSDQPPGLALQWSNGASGTNVFGLVPGYYSVTISVAASACSYTLNYTVPLEDCDAANLPALRISEGAAPVGSNLCLPVYAANFMGLDSLQLAISWNPGGLQFASLQPSLIGLSGFDISAINDGLLRLNWKSPGLPLQIDSEAELFRVCFDLGGNPGQSFPVFFDAGLQLPQAHDALGQPFDSLYWQNGVVLIQPPVAGEGLRLSVSSETAFFGQPVCTDVFAEGFSAIVGGQFSLRWAKDSLQFDSIIYGALPNLSAFNFNLNNTSEGFLRFQWLDQALNGVSLPDSSVLFSACFTAGSEPGSSLVRISSTPTAIEFVSGTTVVPVEVAAGLVNILPPSVWPGDANADGRVNHFDLLHIGLAYGASGPARPGASLLWQPQAAPEWPLLTPASQVNYRHIDTNGDGLVEAADTLALAQNWGLTANIAPPSPLPSPLLDAQLFVQSDTAAPGEELILDIVLGDTSLPIFEAYGLAFSLVYDVDAVEPGSISVSFGQSWLGDIHTDMLAMSRSNSQPGRLDIALVRTDGLDASGAGPLAHLHFMVKDSAFATAPDYYEMVFQIEHARLINHQEASFSLTTPPSSVLVEGLTSSARDRAAGPEVKVFPSPAQEAVFLYSPHAAILQVDLFSLEGRLLAAYQQAREISVAGLPPGVYMLRIQTERGISVQRFAVAR